MAVHEPSLIIERLDRIEQAIMRLVQQETVKGWYTTAEMAMIVERSAYTVREWCREGRIVAEKRRSGRGCAKEWMISHEELTRFRDEGLL